MLSKRFEALGMQRVPASVDFGAVWSEMVEVVRGKVARDEYPVLDENQKESTFHS